MTLQHVWQQAVWMGGVTRELILAMGIGVKWLFMTLRIIVFGILVTPYFLSTILWYITAPTIIRHVSYRTSNTTRQRHLRSLVKRARQAKVQELRQPIPSAPPSHASTPREGTLDGETVSATAAGQGVGDDEGPLTSTWARIAGKVPFLTPARSSKGRLGTSSGSRSYDLLRDGPSSNVLDEASAVPKDEVSTIGNPTTTGTPQLDSSSFSSSYEEEDDDDEDAMDPEDSRNLHNRAAMDIYLPCPLDDLLRVQHRLFRGHSIHSPPGSPHRSQSDLHNAAPSASERVQIKKYPIVICVSGGAWIIGSHLWSVLLARLLSAQGAVVFCPDYRNFPQSNMGEMTRDVSDAIGWVIRNADRYHGDLSNVTLLGQSAGAHLCWMSLISQAQMAAAKEEQAAAAKEEEQGQAAMPGAHEMDEYMGATVCNDATLRTLTATTTTVASEVGAADAAGIPCSEGMLGGTTSGRENQVYLVPRYHPRRSIHRFVSLSGIYDLPHLLRHFHGRGLYRKVLYRIAGGKERLRSEFCINRYFDARPSVVTPAVAPKASPAPPATVDRHQKIPAAGSGGAAEAATLDSMFANTVLPKELQRALLKDGEGKWSMEQLLMNDSFLDLAADQRPQMGSMAADQPKAQPQGTTPCSDPLAFMDKLPHIIEFLHGDEDCSAPISEPMRLYHKIVEAQKARRDAGCKPGPLDVSVVCVAHGTHTNVIVEELFGGKGVVVTHLCRELGLGAFRSGGKLNSSNSSNAKSSKIATAVAAAAESAAPSADATVAKHYRVVPMEVPPGAQGRVLRLAAYVCPF